MGQSSMSLDTEAISTAINRVNGDIAEFQDAMNSFVTLLNEKVADNHGNFALLSTLANRLQEEVANVRKLEESSAEIERITREYVRQAEEANDDSAFR